MLVLVIVAAGARDCIRLLVKSHHIEVTPRLEAENVVHMYKVYYMLLVMQEFG